MNKLLALASLVGVLLTTGCATLLEQQLEADLDRRRQILGPAREDLSEPGPPAKFDGRLEGYLAYALEHSPLLRARFDEWRAATHRIASTRRLPEPTFTWGLFLSQVETRVGPQRHRFSLSQAFPWPTQLTAAADAAGLEAKSAERRFDAALLMIVRRITTAYWKLWTIDRTREVKRDQLTILGYLFESARVRLEVGQAGLADLSQIQLSTARLTDELSGLDEQQQQAAAELLAAAGAPPGSAVKVPKDEPPLWLPAENEAELRQAVAEHPDVEALGLMADARVESGRSAEAEGFPGFMIGLDYIETGETDMPGVEDSGKDAVILSLGMRIPLWWGAYDAKRDQAEAEGAAFRAKQAAARDEALEALSKALSQLRDAVRRVKLYKSTLLPQAETTYGAVLGSYQTGKASLAQVLLAQRDLLDLQLGLFRARAEHAALWARLEEVAGRQVKAREVK